MHLYTLRNKMINSSISVHCHNQSSLHGSYFYSLVCGFEPFRRSRCSHHDLLWWLEGDSWNFTHWHSHITECRLYSRHCVTRSKGLRCGLYHKASWSLIAEKRRIHKAQGSKCCKKETVGIQWYTQQSLSHIHKWHDYIIMI